MQAFSLVLATGERCCEFTNPCYLWNYLYCYSLTDYYQTHSTAMPATLAHLTAFSDIWFLSPIIAVISFLALYKITA